MDLTTLAIPILSFGAVATAVLAGSKLVSGAHGLARRLSQYTGASAVPKAPSPDGAPAVDLQLLRQEKYSNWALLDQMIARRSWAQREAAELERADIPLRVGEYLLLRGLCAAALAIIGFVVAGNLLVAVAAGVPGYFLPLLWVKHHQRQRRRKFDDQLVEALMLLASSLRSGYSFLQGMEAITREMPPPISQEFERLIQELAIGAAPDEALLRLIERVRSEDLELAVTAIMIQRTVGGELSGILDTIVRTIRERQKIKRDIMTLTAQQRWSGYIIAALPVVVTGFVWLGNRAYVNELLFTFHGQVMLAAAGLMEVAGLFMIRRIIAIEV
jgi:tight adherence protein B